MIPREDCSETILEAWTCLQPAADEERCQAKPYLLDVRNVIIEPFVDEVAESRVLVIDWIREKRQALGAYGRLHQTVASAFAATTTPSTPKARLHQFGKNW